MLTIGEWERRFIDFTSLTIALHYSTAMELGDSELHLFNCQPSCPCSPLSSYFLLIIHLIFPFPSPTPSFICLISLSSICLLSPFLPAPPQLHCTLSFPVSTQSQRWSPVTPTPPWLRRVTWRSWTAQPGENGRSSSAGREVTRSSTPTETPGTPLPLVPTRRRTRCCPRSR